MTIIEAEKVPEPNLTVDKTTETEQETSTEENTDANFEPQEIISEENKVEENPSETPWAKILISIVIIFVTLVFVSHLF